MQEHVIKTYSFGELSEEAQQTALEKFYDINVDFEEWSECIIDDAKELGSLMGIEIRNIFYSGFYSQGDGACFEGSYAYQKGGLKAIKEYAPQDQELHRIARGLQAIQRPNFYQLSATVKQSGHYMHSHCTDINVLKETDYDSWHPDWDITDGISELLRDFMDWIYRQLDKEYEFQTGKEQIKDTILANDYQFNKDGTFNTCY